MYLLIHVLLKVLARMVKLNSENFVTIQSMSHWRKIQPECIFCRIQPLSQLQALPHCFLIRHNSFIERCTYLTIIDFKCIGIDHHNIQYKFDVIIFVYSLFLLCRKNRLDLATSLVKSPRCDPNIPTEQGQTPLDLATSPKIIQLLLENGATPSYCNMEKCFFPGQFQKDPADMIIKMFVVGDPGAGKSTLVKSIQTEGEGFAYRLLNQLTKVKNVDEKTAGIIPHDINTKAFGRVTLYDFAGHREFYAGHDAILRSSIGNAPSIIVLVVNMRDEVKKIKEKVQYWIEFLGQQIYSVRNKPHLLVVGSHVDEISSGNVKFRSNFLQSIINSNLGSFTSTEQFVLDCRYAERTPMSNLRKRLSFICQNLRSLQKVDFASHFLLVFLLDKFRDDPAVSLTSVEQEIKNYADNKDHWVWMKSLNLPCCCEKLNNQGNILFMKRRRCIEKSWIILNMPVLLSRVNGKLFAPEGFKEHRKVATSTGVVTLSSISSLFPDLNPDMISQFLCHLEFCQEIKDTLVLKMLQSNTESYYATEKFFFFPALVCHDTPTDLWQQSDEFGYHTGWIIKCSKSEQFLTTRFLQVLLLRLAFNFALVPSDSCSAPTTIPVQRKCFVWKNGISWANQSGSEAIIEVDQRKVVVMTRSKQMKLKSVNLRSLVIQVVLLTKSEFCPRVLVKESVILPEYAIYYPINLTQSKTIDITDVALTVKEGEKFVVLDHNQTIELDKLLHFEAYSMLNEQILHDLFDQEIPQHHLKISRELIYLIAEHAHIKTDDFITICKPSLWQLSSCGAHPRDKLAQVLQLWKEEKTMGTPCHLHCTLDQFSVFAGRNPLMVCEGNDKYMFNYVLAIKLI